MDHGGEAGSQSRVCRKELLHQVRVPRGNHRKVLPVVLHGLDEDVDGRNAKVLSRGIPGEGVGLIDKEHAAHRGVDDRLRPGLGLPDVAADQGAPVRLDELAGGEDTELFVDLPDEPCDGRLAGAGVSGEHHVERDGGGDEAVLSALLCNPDHVYGGPDFLFYGVEPDEAIELCEELFQAQGIVFVLCGSLFGWRGSRRFPLCGHKTPLQVDPVCLEDEPDLVHVLLGEGMIRKGLFKSSSLCSLPRWIRSERIEEELAFRLDGLFIGAPSAGG